MGKKKAKASSSASSEEGGGAKETTPHAPVRSDEKFVKVDFKLLNWHYMNFQMKLKEETHIFTIKKMLRERHGRLEELKVCLGSFTESNELVDEMLTLKDCGVKGTPIEIVVDAEGKLREDDSLMPIIQFFYDFKPANHSDAILHYFGSS